MTKNSGNSLQVNYNPPHQMSDFNKVWGWRAGMRLRNIKNFVLFAFSFFIFFSCKSENKVYKEQEMTVVIESEMTETPAPTSTPIPTATPAEHPKHKKKRKK